MLRRGTQLLMSLKGPTLPPATANLKVVVCTMIPGGGCMTPALQCLGYKPYTFFTSIRDGKHMTHPPVWMATLQKAQPIPPGLLTEMDCLVGPPGSLAVAHLLQSCGKETKFILVKETDKELLAANLHRSITEFQAALPNIASRAKAMIDVLYPDQSARLSASGLESFEEVVIDRIPRERLLIFTHGDGWEPLCEFLDKEMPPESTRFPEYVDGTAELDVSTRRSRRVMRLGYTVMGIVVFFFAGVLYESFRSMDMLQVVQESVEELRRNRLEQPDMSPAELTYKAAEIVKRETQKKIDESYRPVTSSDSYGDLAASVVEPLSVKRYKMGAVPKEKPAG